MCHRTKYPHGLPAEQSSQPWHLPPPAGLPLSAEVTLSRLHLPSFGPWGTNTSDSPAASPVGPLPQVGPLNLTASEAGLPVDPAAVANPLAAAAGPAQSAPSAAAAAPAETPAAGAAAPAAPAAGTPAQQGGRDSGGGASSGDGGDGGSSLSAGAAAGLAVGAAAAVGAAVALAALAHRRYQRHASRAAQVCSEGGVRGNPLLPPTL